MGIRVKIPANNFIFNKQISIDLSQAFDFTKDTDIDLFSQQALKDNINPIVDKELKKFNPIGIDNTVLNYSISGFTNYVPNIFTQSNILNNDPVFYKSLWILEYFDSVFKNNQNRLFINYYRPQRLLVNNNNSLVLDSTIKIPLQSDDIANIFIPNNLISTLINSTLYLKVRFFNAKNGLIYNFKKSTILVDDETEYYIKIQLNTTSKTWTLADSITNFTNYVNANDDSQSNSAPNIITDDNSNKGTFINIDGKYQNGSTTDNSSC